MKREFMVERQGKPFVLYSGLLDLAHEQGLKSIRTQLIQTPSADNGKVAICYAEVTTEKGTFTGLGDASPESASKMMLPHILRLAETRAKARALRDAVNVGVAALEELAADDDESPPTAQPQSPTRRPDAAPEHSPAPSAANDDLPPALQNLSQQCHLVYRSWRDIFDACKTSDDLKAKARGLASASDNGTIPTAVLTPLRQYYQQREQALKGSGHE